MDFLKKAVHILVSFHSWQTDCGSIMFTTPNYCKNKVVAAVAISSIYKINVSIDLHFDYNSNALND